MANKFFYLNGGSERVFFQEKEFLAGKGIEVVDFSMRDPRNEESPYSEYFVENINYKVAAGPARLIRTALSFLHSSEAVDKLKQILEKEAPDIAHLHNIYHQLTPSIIPILRQHGVKVVLTLHDYKLICPSYLALCGNEICTACNGSHFWKLLTRRCQESRMQCLLLSLEAFFHKFLGSYESVDLFLSPSRFLADLAGRRVVRDKIRVLHNGIDLAEYQPNYSDHGYALYFGRISKEKGIETLLTAHNGISSKMPLKIVGSGPLLEPLREKFPKAEFIGYNSGEKLNGLIKNAAFVIVPSEWYENCSMAVLEAMAFGKPVIGARIGGIPEQVEDGRTGFLFETGNAEELADRMLKLWNSKEMRKAMGKAARIKTENEYSLKNHCGNLLSIYEKVLAA